MDNDPNRPIRNNIAADPVVGERKAGFNPLWLLLLLLLIPLLFLPFCHHRDADRAPGAAATPTGTATTVANPFNTVTTGDDAGKAVLNFDVNATTPNSAGESTLGAVIAYLQANPSAKVSLKGFTDNTGTAEINQKLTQQRIDTVKNSLTRAGVDAGRITTANLGEAYPITDNSNPQARELNRRVEITLSK